MPAAAAFGAEAKPGSRTSAARKVSLDLTHLIALSWLFPFRRCPTRSQGEAVGEIEHGIALLTVDELTTSQWAALADVAQIERGCALVPRPERRGDFHVLVALGLARSYGQGLGGEGFAPTAAGRKEAKRSASGPSSSKPRGFALLTAERRREIASMGGKSVAPEDRAFSKDRNLAAAAGRVGGEKKPAHLVDGK